MLENIRIVLVNTTHPGNIGGVARAMKNMGLTDLCLVKPKTFPHADAVARAAGAGDLLDSALLVEDLDQALADCHLVVGTSARSRTIPWPLVNPRELASIVTPLPQETKIAIVFGREDRGLTNDELQRCHHHVHIPVNEDFSSLNLAAAVQVISYELRMAQLLSVDSDKPQWGTDWDVELAENRELELLFGHLEQTLTEIEFLDPEKPRNLMPRLRRLLLRAVPDKIEVNVLRGMLSAVQKYGRR
ncbi:tRNA (cytosine(32)/uridine(32)-2'-O)-methyltransferase TrmJ [Amphritea balenae]|uniref:tRNA (cytidine/uridine-2'-O-)-methyltransferase TrmJ n=1 Tax=Amphritea balenae TaxID=452629 RepID=A0A3P1ST73_9GAMM|nr:tRNA (cytosine(32)/uridine(32)-2'-O)-methyltransferase TrmJ [Amphritea balenae]RRC99795.1 tRNA (cytosine(32)/uridine(32)-2'-O)-methyltransferase TrmJ [Amphritea balenae]GGK79636.1 tRNA (cytidine/uridine-2'-O-)-methyltransferase TrmJ [Amphritea balenae]